MNVPDFYDRAPEIRVRDRLSAFLGAAEDGVLVYSYLDAVKLAGHSCPTVAGTWLMTAKALQALFGDEIPERGGVRVTMAEAEDEGVAGVMAAVAGLVTGAAGPGGFKGIGGDFSRAGLLRFGVAQPGEMAFARRDTGASVAVRFNAAVVPPDPQMRPLLMGLIQGHAAEGDAAAFARLWQERVRAILIDHAEDPDVVALLR